MTLTAYKVPIVNGINDTPAQIGDPNYPNDSLFCEQYNALIDNLDSDSLPEGTKKFFTNTLARAAISVTGNGSYNSSTGVITVGNSAVDHVSLTNTVGLTKTYTFWADAGGTIEVGTFEVTDGTDGVDGSGVVTSSAVNNGNGTHTVTFWGDMGQTINLGTVTLNDGADGQGVPAGGTANQVLAKINSTDYNTQWLTLSSASLNTANTFTKAQTVATVALTDGATINVDASLSNVFNVTLGGNRTLANPTNLTAGQTLIFKIKQDATGSRTLSFGTNYKFSGGSAPTLTTTANKLDIISCVSDGTNLYCNFVGNF